MQRIQQPQETQINDKSAALLGQFRELNGGVPNLLKTLAHSSAALDGYLSFADALSKGELSPSLAEQIALTVAKVNGCRYCASAHTALGRKQGLSSEEIALNLNAQASEPDIRAALQFARSIAEQRGHISDAELAAVRNAGFSDAEITEIVAHVALNSFTNFFNNTAHTDIDFPVVQI